VKKLRVFRGGKKTGTEAVFIGTKSGLTRYWSFRDQQLQRFVFSLRAFTFFQQFEVNTIVKIGLSAIESFNTYLYKN